MKYRSKMRVEPISWRLDYVSMVLDGADNPRAIDKIKPPAS